jgi:hypothetical protein
VVKILLIREIVVLVHEQLEVRLTAAADWRRIHSATPQRNALTCRDRCAFLSGEGWLFCSAPPARSWMHMTATISGNRSSSDTEHARASRERGSLGLVVLQHLGRRATALGNGFVTPGLGD